MPCIRAGGRGPPSKPKRRRRLCRCVRLTGHDTAGPAPQDKDESSSKPVFGATCEVYSAVHDVEVGDFNYGDKNYRGALVRYQSALDEKPNDPGILLRLGKALEKLGDLERAKDKYQASIAAGPDKPSAKEATAALDRIKAKASK